jgi:hypothetical protein
VKQPEGAEAEDRFSEELAAVAVTARRRAERCGDEVVDTAYLLHSLLEWDPAVRAFLGGDSPRTAKLLGYLAQRSIGYGQRWRNSMEESAAARSGESAGKAKELLGALPRWSPAAVSGMGMALERAEARGAPRVEGVDLLAGLVADRSCRAAEVLGNSGFDAAALSMMLDVRSETGDTPVAR